METEPQQRIENHVSPTYELSTVSDMQTHRYEEQRKTEIEIKKLKHVFLLNEVHKYISIKICQSSALN